MTENIVPFYEGWRYTNERLVEKIGSLSLQQLELRPSPDLWPIWATAAHVAGSRVYWLCDVVKERGAERTPFTDASTDGWEDDLAHPRGPSELVFALQSTWGIVQECLERWTPETLEKEVRRERAGKIQVHTRQSILMRLITHDAEHCGEISQTLGIHGLGELDLWTGRVQRFEPVPTLS